MKRKFLFVLMLFVALTGFKNKEVETSGDFGVTKILLPSEMGLPKITDVAPENGDVIGYEGQIVAFSLAYTANPGANYKVYRMNGNEAFLIGGSDVLKSQNRVTVRIENVTQASNGNYKIVVTNSIGSVEQNFTVRIHPEPPTK